MAHWTISSRTSKKSTVHESHTSVMFSRVLRRHLPTICDIFEVALDAGLVIVDSGATETVGSPEALQLMGGRRGRTLSYGCQPPHGWFGTCVIESTGVRMLLSIKGPRALQATVDFATNTMTYVCVNCSNGSICDGCDEPNGTSVMGPDRCKDWSTLLTTSVPAND